MSTSVPLFRSLDDEGSRREDTEEGTQYGTYKRIRSYIIMTYQTRCSLQFYHPHVRLKAANDECMLGGWRDPLALLEMLILTDDGFINTTNTTCNGQRENSRDEFP